MFHYERLLPAIFHTTRRPISNVSSTSILFSRLFKFIIGADDISIVIHEAAFADLSPALATLMRGRMSEGLAGEAKWEDVDRGTFVRFIQFAYTGDYSIPKCSILDPGPEIVEEAPPLNPSGSQLFAVDDWAFGTTFSKKGKASKKNFFDSLKYPLLKTRPNFANAYEPKINDCSSENIGEVLLGHASLYVLADKWESTV